MAFLDILMHLLKTNISQVCQECCPWCMCKVCSSLGQKWGNERAITGSKIILTCPFDKMPKQTIMGYMKSRCGINPTSIAWFVVEQEFYSIWHSENKNVMQLTLYKSDVSPIWGPEGGGAPGWPNLQLHSETSYSMMPILALRHVLTKF